MTSILPCRGHPSLFTSMAWVPHLQEGAGAGPTRGCPALHPSCVALLSARQHWLWQKWPLIYKLHLDWRNHKYMIKIKGLGLFLVRHGSPVSIVLKNWQPGSTPSAFAPVLSHAVKNHWRKCLLLPCCTEGAPAWQPSKSVWAKYELQSPGGLNTVSSGDHLVGAHYITSSVSTCEIGSIPAIKSLSV